MKAPHKSLKISDIESITDESEFTRILTILLESIGLKETITHEDKHIISSSINVPGLGIQNFAFIIDINSSLSDSNEYNTIINKASELLQNGIYSKIYIVSNKYISNGIKTKINTELATSLIDYWDRDDIIQKIDSSYSDYWKHSDQDLLAYEKSYTEDFQEDYTFNKLKQFKSAHEKLYDIFIEPRIYHKTKDKESPDKFLSTINVDKLKSIDDTLIIEGEPGSGKTRLLRELGRLFIKENESKKDKKNLPVFFEPSSITRTQGQ